jgi:catechol 2,3-dioxygenase-like lactoylglutathione lyase family enzyme
VVVDAGKRRKRKKNEREKLFSVKRKKCLQKCLTGPTLLEMHRLCYGQQLSQERAMRPKTDGILESSLYVSDLPRSVRFYEETFGFRAISDFGERGCAMQAHIHQVLLLFKKGASRAIQSPHDGDGELHLAFAIPADELANWESWLQTRGIAVEEKRNWGAGASTFETLTAI